MGPYSTSWCSPSAHDVADNLLRGVIGSVCETHQRAKAVRGSQPEKVESGKGGFKVGGKNRSALKTADPRQDFFVQKWQAAQIGFVAGRDNNMVGDLLENGAIAALESKTNLFLRDLRPTHLKAEGERHTPDDPIAHGPASCRAQMCLHDLHANLSGQAAEQAWILGVYERLQARTYAGRRLTHPFPKRTLSGQPPVVKYQFLRPGDQMYDRALLMEQRRNIKRGSARPDDCYSCATEFLQIAMREAMRHERRRTVLQCRRNILEVADSYRHGDVSRLQLFIIFKSQTEATGETVELRDQFWLEVRSKTFLEGQTVGNERFKTNRNIRWVILDALLCAKMRQGEGGLWVRKTRCEPIGLKEHALRHVVAPRIHGTAKDAVRDRNCPQMGGQRQAVRPSTDDGYFCGSGHSRLKSHCFRDGSISPIIISD